MRSVDSLTDDELKSEIVSFGRNVGPITATTRSVYEKLLGKLRSEKAKGKSNASQESELTRSSDRLSMTSNKSSKVRVSKKKAESSESGGSSEADIQSNTKSLTLTPAMTVVKAKPKKITNPPATRRTQTSFSSTDRVIETSSVPSAATFSRSSLPTGSKSYTATGANSSGLFTDLTQSYIERFVSSSTPVKNDRGDKIKIRAYEEQETEDDYSDDHMESSRYLKSQHTPPIFDRKYISSSTPTGVSKPRPFNESFTTTFQPSIRQRSGLSSANAVGSDIVRARYGKQSTLDVPKLIFYSFVSLFAFLAIAYSSIVHSHLIIDGSKFIAFTARDGASFLYTYALLPVIASVFVVGIVALVIFITQRRKAITEQKKMQLFQLIERIIDIIRESSENSQPYVAEPHVRDMLIPPLKRSPDCPEWIRWQEAVKFINLNESRVCTETRIVNGVECCVWRWLPTKKTGWQGNAFEKQFNLAGEALTRCLKVRGMFSSRKPGTDGDDVALSLRQKIAPVQPEHLHVANDSREGVVFAKFATLSDCKQAYDALHGTWFNGQLVSVKFLREDRYAEHFSETRKH